MEDGCKDAHNEEASKLPHTILYSGKVTMDYIEVHTDDWLSVVVLIVDESVMLNFVREADDNFCFCGQNPCCWPSFGHEVVEECVQWLTT
jgi:hypothetical protein